MPPRNIIFDRPVLLIGATGQLGRELRRSLLAFGAVDTPGRSILDLRNPETIRQVIRDRSPSLVVNAAAYTDVDEAEDNAALAHQINGVAPGVLAEESRRLGIPLIHFSTDYVFDGSGNAGASGSPRPYCEEDPPAPLNVYGKSKLAGEQAIQAVNPMHLILRTGWVFSSRGRNFLRTIQRLCANQDELLVVDDQIGSPTWAGLLADATACLVARSVKAGLDAPRLANDEMGGLYHLTAAGSDSWCGFARAIVDVGLERGNADGAHRVTAISTGDYPRPAERPAFSVLDNSKINDRFGVCLPHWREHLRLCLGI